MRIGFDFDKVFVDYPPFVPEKLINWLYKKHNHKLSYRIPGKLEQKIRILSHYSLLRPPIKESLRYLPELAKNNNLEIYLISSRFGFLKEKTKNWLKKYKIEKYFKGIFFNFNNKQPHLFKSQKIKELEIEKYVDDDLDLLYYLSKENTKIKFYWINKSRKKDLPENIIQIDNLKNFKTEYLQS